MSVRHAGPFRLSPQPPGSIPAADPLAGTLVPDLVRLQALVDQRVVTRGTRLGLPDGRVIFVEDLEGIRLPEVDPWAAWDEDEDTGEAPPSPTLAPSLEEPSPLPTTLLEPLSGPSTPATPVPRAPKMVVGGSKSPAPRPPGQGRPAPPKGEDGGPKRAPLESVRSVDLQAPPSRSEVSERPLRPEPPPEAPRFPAGVSERGPRVEPVRPAAQREEPEGPPDNVIAFPQGGGARGRTQGSSALADLPAWSPPEAPTPRPHNEAQPQRKRWFGIAFFGAAAVLLAFVINYSVRTTAETRFPPPPERLRGRPADVAVPPPTSAPPPSVSGQVQTTASIGVVSTPDPLYEAMEDDLRTLLGIDPGAPATPDGLKDQLLVELYKMKLLGVRLDVALLEGPKGSAQKERAAELVIRYESRPGELDREIAAIGMVLGRVKRSWQTTLPRIEVRIEGLPEGPLRRVIDQQRAEALYLGRIGILEFLTGG